MKHALLAPLALLLFLAGCADDQYTSQTKDMTYSGEADVEEPPAREAYLLSSTGPASAQPAGDPKAQAADPKLQAGDTKAPIADPKPAQREPSEATRDQALRLERQAYARGLEKILVSNGMSVGVLVYEGQAGPTPTLLFVGSISREFVQRAVTTGAVLDRARALGFRSVDFFDRGPDSHFQFVLSKTGPLPKCAAYNRLCL
jgi:hypothetical protein